MAKGKKKEAALSTEERIEAALVSTWEQPYKVPKNWQWVRLSSICDFERGITFPASEKHTEADDGLIPCLRTANVQDELDLDNLIYVNRKFIKENRNKLSKLGDIIMSSANSRELVGKVSFVNELPFETTFGGFVLTIRAKESAVINKFLFYMLRSEFLAGHFMGESTQTTNIANISTTTLGEYCFPLAPIAEQQRIVDRIESLFAKLDEAKEKAQEALDSFELRKSALLHKAFMGVLTAKWRCDNNSNYCWEKTTLGYVCRLENGYAFKSEKFSSSEGVPVIRISNISEDGVDIDSCVLTTETDVGKRFLVQNGDLLIAMSGATTGKNGVYSSSKKAFLNQRVGNIKVKNSEILSDKFRNYYIMDMQDIILQNAYGGAQPNISSGRICEMEFQLPPLKEQLEIVRLLDAFFAKEAEAKAQVEATLEAIDLMKKAILAKAFRGELGTNDPTEESAEELLKQVLSAEIPTTPPAKKSKSAPKELKEKLETELERKIIQLYFKRETDSLPAEVIISVSSKKFEVMEALYNLERRGILKKLNNGNYRLLG